MNKCSFSGRLTRDPEVITFDSGSKKVRFSLAVDRSFKNKDTGEWENKASFLNFEAWGNGGERIAAGYRKGDFMLVTDASAISEEWVDKATEQKRSKIVFRCNEFEKLPGLNYGKGSRNGGASPAGKADRAEAPNEYEGTEAAVPAGVGDDEIPF